MILKLFGYTLIFVTVAPSLDWFWQRYDIESPEKTWAISIAMILIILKAIIDYCLYSQFVLKDRVQQCAESKKKLEESLLGNRRSSE